MELINEPRRCGDGLDWGRRDMVDFTFYLLNYKNESLDDKFVVDNNWELLGR